MEELKNQIAKVVDRDEQRTGKMVLQFICHIGSFTKMPENKWRNHRHYAFYSHESLKSGIQIFLATAISLYKEDTEYTIFTSNRKKLWNEPFDLGSPQGNPRSPLLCHPCYRLWPAEPLTWQDLIWGLPPTVCLSCNKVSKPQGLLHIGFLSLTFLQAPQIPLWRSPQAPTSQTCQVPWVCPYVATEVTWEVKMVAVQWAVLASEVRQPWLTCRLDLISTQFQPVVWGGTNCWQHETFKSVISGVR